MALDDAFWQAQQQSLVQAILPMLTQMADDAARGAYDALPSASRVAVDWGTASTAAQSWATDYGYDLVKGLTDTTRAFLRDAITEWASSGQPLSELLDQLEPVFGAQRASLIGATEVTRVYHSAGVAVWKQSDIVTGYRFNTDEDATVCDECAALDGQVFGLDDDDNAPPLHPGCRCYSSPATADDQ